MTSLRSPAPGDGVGQWHVRQQNRELILTLLARHGSLDRSGLARETGLARPSVSRIVGDLTDEGWVVESPPLVEGARGRPRTTISLRPGQAVIFGVDVRVEGVLIQGRDLGGGLLVESRHALGRDEPAERAVALIVDEVVAHARQLDRAPAGIGLAVGATLDRDQRVIVTTGYRPWRDLPLVDRVSDGVAQALGRAAPPVVMRDVASCAAIANWQEVAGSDPTLSTLAHLQIGIGAGAGLVDRRLGHAEIIASPQIAHVPLRPGGARCTCGARGCFDAVAGFPALVRAAEGTGLTPSEGPQAIEDFCARLEEEAERGSRSARSAVHLMADHFAQAAAALVNITQPSRLTYGGYPINLGHVFRDRFIETLQPHVDRALVGPGGLLASTDLGDRASIFGAYLLALRVVLQRSAGGVPGAARGVPDERPHTGG